MTGLNLDKCIWDISPIFVIFESQAGSYPNLFRFFTQVTSSGPSTPPSSHPGHGSVRIGLVPRYVSPITALSAFIQVLSSGYTFRAEARTLLMSGFFLMQLGTKDISCFHLQETRGECTRLSEHKSTGKETSMERHSNVSTNT